jgi:hypothetical protein
MNEISPVLCAYCGAKLDALEIHFGDVCFQESCVRRRSEADWGSARTVAAEQTGVENPLSYPVIPVPAQSRELTPLPEERANAFRSHLAHTIDEAFSLERNGAEFHETEPETSWFPPELTEWLGSICAACSGYCCEAGGDTAFLTTDTIRRIARREPDITPAEIAARYRDRLPDESYEGACVFQSATGCTLPRGDRANICNLYLCRGLKLARDNWRESDTRRAFVARMSTSGLASYSFLDGGGSE